MTEELTDTKLDAIEQRRSWSDFDGEHVRLTPAERDRLVAALRSERTQNAQALDEIRDYAIDGLRYEREIDDLRAELERERTQNRELQEALDQLVDEVRSQESQYVIVTSNAFVTAAALSDPKEEATDD